jgi:hypothetical protein
MLDTLKRWLRTLPASNQVVSVAGYGNVWVGARSPSETEFEGRHLRIWQP